MTRKQKWVVNKVRDGPTVSDRRVGVENCKLKIYNHGLGRLIRIVGTKV